MSKFEFRALYISFAVPILFSQCSNMNIKSLNSFSELKIKTDNAISQAGSTPRPLSTVFFFDEQFAPGGFCYAYPNKSRVSYTDTVSKNGIFSVQVKLDANDYSGGSICRGNGADLTLYRQNAALKLWIKGHNGGEIASIGLVDESRSSREKAVVRLPISNYISISTEWQQVSIPLIDFSDRGVYWDARQRAEIPCDIDWSKIAEIRIEIKKGENTSFTIFIDDISIEPNVIDSAKYKPDLAWDRFIETVSPPHATENSTDEPEAVFFNGSLPKGGFTYVYGGKTACVPQKNAMYSDQQILTCYLDDKDYSGVSVVVGNKKSIDLKELHKNGGLIFWAKGIPKNANLQVGLLDHNKDNRKIQSRVSLEQYGNIDENWKMFTIPLRHFSDIGYYWDEKSCLEAEAPINWSSIYEIRFSCGKSNTTNEDSTPVILYLDDIKIVKDLSESSDTEKYWNEFESSEPEVLLHNFQNIGKDKWVISKGAESETSYEIMDAPEHAPETISKCMSVTYSLKDWCDVIYSYAENKTDSIKRNWTKHWGLRFLLYTEKEFQGITVQIADSGNELFVANIGALQGWNDIIIPFREFSKFIHYQPSDAILNNRFDLDGVQIIDFKASGNGTSGAFKIGNIRLTNERDSKTGFGSAQPALKK